jgi:hypothetical protein
MAGIGQESRLVGYGTKWKAISGSAQAERSIPGRIRKQEEETGKRRETNTGNRQKDNTGINTQEIMGKMGDIWRGVETSRKTGETDQGVTNRTDGKGRFPTYRRIRIRHPNQWPWCPLAEYCTSQSYGSLSHDQVFFTGYK